MSISKINRERLEYLMRQLRGKIRAGCSGTYKHFVPQVLDEEGEHNLQSRALYARAMREQIASEIEMKRTVSEEKVQ